MAPQPAQEVYDRAGAALRQAPLYVDPQANAELGDAALTEEEQAQILAQLEGSSTPIFVAVLPAAAYDAGGPAPALLFEAAGSMPGTYLVLLANGLYDAGSNVIQGGEADDIAATAWTSSEGDVGRFLTDFTSRVELAAEPGTEGASDTGPDPSALLVPAGVVALALGGGVLVWRRNKRRQERAQLEQVRPALDEDITAYGEELAALDLGARTTGDAESRQRYSRALDLYDQAKQAADRAEKPGQLGGVTATLEEGRWELAAVRAQLAGKPVPERRPPCFFDPRHGPSVEDVEWAPPGGVSRVVPACAADAVRLRDGDDPDIRTVPVGEGRRPYYDAGPAYAGWAGGYYGAVLPALLWGTVLGSSFGADGLIAEGGLSEGLDPGDSGWGGGFDSGSGWGGGSDGGGGFDGGF